MTSQAGQKETPTEKMPPDSEKKKKIKKKKKKAKEGPVEEPSWRGKGLGECTPSPEGAAGTSASTAKKAGPKVTALQEALDEIALREQLDEQFRPLANPAPSGAQAPAISLQEVMPKEGE